MSLPREVKKQAQTATAIQAQLRGDPPEGAEPDNPQPSKNDQVDWEHRFKTQKQKYDEVVPELRTENQDLKQRIEALEGMIEKAAEPAPPAAQTDDIFTSEEIEEYGEDFLKMVQRVADMRVANQDVTKELSELKDQFKSIAQNQAKTAQETFFDHLTEMVPDWEQINDNPAFHDWLAEQQPLTGKERQVFLTDAQQRLDAKSVAQFFTTWKGESVSEPSLMPDSVNGYVADMTADSTGQEVVTRADIQQFYHDKKLGKYRGREDEARQIERKIFEAQNAGRIR